MKTTHHQCSIESSCIINVALIISSFHPSSHSISTCQGITVSPKIRWAGTRNLGSPGWIGGGIQRSLSGRGLTPLFQSPTCFSCSILAHWPVYVIIITCMRNWGENHIDFYDSIDFVYVQRRRVAGSFWIWSGHSQVAPPPAAPPAAPPTAPAPPAAPVAAVFAETPATESEPGTEQWLKGQPVKPLMHIGDGRRNCTLIPVRYLEISWYHWF